MELRCSRLDHLCRPGLAVSSATSISATTSPSQIITAVHGSSLLAGTLHEVPKWTSTAASPPSRTAVCPILQAASSRSLLLSYIISMMILITTRERGIWILQIRNSKPHNGRSIHDTDSFAIPKYATHTKAQHRPISRALTCCSALRPCLFLLSVNHSDFTLRVPHPQPLVER
jgi:hypothetical protein